MNRRSFLALLATPALIELIAACGSTSAKQSGPQVLASKKPRVEAGLSEADAAAVAINAFGSDMYARLAANSANENLVFSPASIVLALAMTRAGARGATAAEMDAVLHLDTMPNAPRAMNALSANFGERNAEFPDGVGNKMRVQLAIANSMWVQTGFDLEQAFLDVLATEYGAEAHTVDYKSDPNAARALVNQWVAEQTEARIPQLLPDGAVTVDTRLALVNAVYMKAPWASPFEESNTSDGEFTTTSGAAVQAKMMAQHDTLAYGETDRLQAVELRYVGAELSMMIILPRPDVALSEAMAALVTQDGLALGPTDIDLRLPKFDIETATGLADVLGEMGMPTAFSGQADFGGITKAERLLVGSVVHQANITVDEKGTEAAAATAVVMAATAIQNPPKPIEMHVNRPFLFAIIDKPSGAMLFLGHIGDPTKARG
jgi:serpin B